MTKFETRNAKIATAEPVAAGRVRDFIDLDAWKLARQLRQAVYTRTKRFPAEERHVLTSQLRRALLSITANIAEGFGRYSYRENIQFCRHARGSAFEVRDHLVSAFDAGYISATEVEELDRMTQRVIQVLNGYIRATQKRAAENQPPD